MQVYNQKMDFGVRQVSVIIAALNSARTIGRAVVSALAQPETVEVLFVDDGSTDETAAAARAAAEGSDRLKVIALAENRGPSAARNMALECAIGTMVCVLDADDWMEEGRIGRLLAIAGTEWDFVADDLLLVESGGMEPPQPMLGIAEPARIDLAEFVAANLPNRKAARRELGYLKPLIRRDFLERHRLRYDPSLRLGEDFALYAAALARGARFQLTQACGYIAEQRADSLSHRHRAADLLALAQADVTLLGILGLPSDAMWLLRQHRRLTLDKYFHRVALDAKAQGDWLAVARAFAGTRSAALHILRETLADRRVGRWFHHRLSSMGDPPRRTKALNPQARLE